MPKSPLLEGEEQRSKIFLGGGISFRLLYACPRMTVSQIYLKDTYLNLLVYRCKTLAGVINLSFGLVRKMLVPSPFIKTCQAVDDL